MKDPPDHVNRPMAAKLRTSPGLKPVAWFVLERGRYGDDRFRGRGRLSRDDITDPVGRDCFRFGGLRSPWMIGANHDPY